MATFEMNGKAYNCDVETLSVLRVVFKAAQKSTDYSAVIGMMDIGIKTGRIQEIFDPAIFPGLTSKERCDLGKFAVGV